MFLITKVITTFCVWQCLESCEDLFFHWKIFIYKTKTIHKNGMFLPSRLI